MDDLEVDADHCRFFRNRRGWCPLLAGRSTNGANLVVLHLLPRRRGCGRDLQKKTESDSETSVMRTGATPGQGAPTPRAVGEGFEPLPKTPGNTQFTRKLAQNPAQLTQKTVQSMPIFSSSSPSGRSWRPVYGKHSFSRPHSHSTEAPRRASVGA